MYLSRLEILGFKSFAQKVNLRFDDGITAIVGPNGCGKTNIVDAIRWVLGEQKQSTLRSSKMEDVIFNGTRQRKALGFAEASLTIENTKGILPTEYSEVTITRRMFRSGESEYLLNKTLCRLKDILNLFMDTGMGANAYSVIELKMVETILSDRTEERRRLFEEAAGVTKYKQNRKATFRKLESVQSDLLRVNDIVKEVQTTVNSLHRQAKKAERYNEMNNLLKESEKNLFEHEFVFLTDALRPLDVLLNSRRSEKSSLDFTLHTEEQELDRLREKAKLTEEKLSVVLQVFEQVRNEIRTLEEKKLVQNERISALSENIIRFEKNKKQLILDKENFELQKMQLGETYLSLLEQIQSEREKYKSLAEELQAAEAIENETKLIVQQASDALIEAMQQLSVKRNELEKYSAHITSLQQQIQRREYDISTAEQRTASLEKNIAELTALDKETRRKFAETEFSFFEKEQRRTEVLEQSEQLQRKIQDIENAIVQRSARLDFFQSLLERNEGLSEGAQFLLGNQEWKSRIVPLADALNTSEEYRVAIETALGETGEFLIVATGAEAEEAIEILKKENKGKVTFACLDRIPNNIIESVQIDIPNCKSAHSVVECTPEIRQLVSLFLGDVVIVNEISDAQEILEKNSNIRCIAKDGQVASSNGLRRGGSLRQGEGISVGRKKQMEELQTELSELHRQKNEIAEAQKKVKENIFSFDVAALQKEVKKIEMEVARVQTQIAQVAFEKKHALAETERYQEEKEKLSNEIEELQKTFNELYAATDILGEKQNEREAVLTNARRTLSEKELIRQQHAATVREANITIVSLEGEERNVLLTTKHNDEQLKNNSVVFIQNEQDISAAFEERITVENKLSDDKLQLENFGFRLNEITSQKETIEYEFKRLRLAMENVEKQIKDKRRLAEDSTNTVHELELKITELKSNLEHLREKSREELQLELEYKTFSDEENFDIEKLRQEIFELKEKISGLGSVNFEAFEQYSTEKERLEFLTKQRDDLLSSEESLMHTITEINTTAQEKFSTTFALIRDNFISIFRTLFDEGDECDLQLEEGVDVLECGIDITAKPRGKRPTSIDLLSGGEKTLTAIALLFAIYLVKPSPFCILDEVDAPLDDSNIDRFIRIIRRFSDNTQFIIVTHNKRTMEAANALYGVTMEEEGVSKILTVRFKDGNGKAVAELATEEA
ncbi:MAG: chromosome segregation protein SMC [Bacteroidota bacterium]